MSINSARRAGAPEQIGLVMVAASEWVDDRRPLPDDGPPASGLAPDAGIRQPKTASPPEPADPASVFPSEPAEPARSALLEELALTLQSGGEGLGELAERVVGFVADRLGGVSTLDLVSADEQWAELAAVAGADEALIGDLRGRIGASREPLEGGIDGLVLESATGLLLPQVTDEALSVPLREEQRVVRERVGIHGLLGVPLRVAGRGIGTLFLLRTDPGPAYSEQDLRLLRDLAERAGLALLGAVMLEERLASDASRQLEEERAQRRQLDARRRAEQLGAVAWLGDRVLAGEPLDTLMSDAAQAVGRGLQTDFVAVLELLPGGHELLMRAGTGWEDGIVGARHVPADERSQAGYTLLCGQAVVVKDLAEETRFLPPALLIDHLVTSSVTVLVRVDGQDHGVLGAYSVWPRDFGQEDVDFLRSVANVLAMAIERQRFVDTHTRPREQDQLAALGQLAAGIAHDFNNILAVITLYGELLGSQPGLDESGREQLDAMRQQAERAVSLVWQILDFAHRNPIERGELDLLPFLVELSSVLQGTFPPGVSVELEHGRDEYVVRGDPTRLHQIFMNLATNARDAMEGAGRLTIRVSRQTVTRVQRPPVAGMAPGSWVRVDVEDTGAGIAPDALPHVFEPFFTTKSPGHGTGLGLAQVYGLVSQHEGHLGIASVPGEGTVVTVWLPAAQRTEAQPAAEVERHVGGGAGERVLVVDDDPAIRMALTRVLTSLGYQPLTAVDGEEAITLLNREGATIRAVISDVMMPGLGGEGLVRAMRERWPDTPVILTSGYFSQTAPAAAPDEGERDAGRDVAAIRLQKPFSWEQLAEVLQAAMGRGQ